MMFLLKKQYVISAATAYLRWPWSIRNQKLIMFRVAVHLLVSFRMQAMDIITAGTMLTAQPFILPVIMKRIKLILWLRSNLFNACYRKGC